MVVALTAAGVAWLALSIFLVVVGLGAGYALVRLGGTFGRLSALIVGTQEEMLPVIGKVGGTVDALNAQLEKMDVVTDSAVGAVEGVDSAIKAVSFAVSRPVQKVSGFKAGVSEGASAFKAERRWRSAVQSGREAARRREQELADRLRETEAAQ